MCEKLREVYTASDEPAAAAALDAFEAEYGAKYPMLVKAWRSRWAEITPFLAFPEEIRRAVYTTNVIEALNRHLRRTLKTKGHLPTDEAAVKLLYLSIQNATRWKRAAPQWQKALLQFAIYFPGRLPE